MTNVCDSFKRLAFDTWDRLKDSRSVNFQLGEETITDLLMLDLKKKHPLDVISKTFSKPAEGSNGADWEWWFREKHYWIGFRVQAKILDISTERFEHLHYRSKKGKRLYQCDKLIKNALVPNYPKWPIYCFYIQTYNSTRLTTWLCGSFASTRDLWGCSLTSAFKVRELRPQRKFRLEDLEASLRPWHCLVCCPAYHSGASLLGRINGYAEENFPLDSDVLKELGIDAPQSFLLSTPPDYVLALRENELINDITPPDPDLAGIALFVL